MIAKLWTPEDPRRQKEGADSEDASDPNNDLLSECVSALRSP